MGSVHPCLLHVPTSTAPGGVTSSRARTPSDLKWLLNERAALAGQLQELSRQENLTQAQIARFERLLSQLLAKAPTLGARRKVLEAKVAALDHAMALAYERVNPAAAGRVNARSDQYGKQLARLTEADIADILTVMEFPGASWDVLARLTADVEKYYPCVPDDLTNKLNYLIKHRRGSAS